MGQNDIDAETRENGGKESWPRARRERVGAAAARAMHALEVHAGIVVSGFAAARFPISYCR